MFNPNTKRNIRTLSAVALVSLGIAAVKEGTVSSDPHRKPVEAPLVDFSQIQDLPDGMNTLISAEVAAANPSVTVERADFKLVNSQKLPAGVKLSKTTDVLVDGHEEIHATLTGPADLNAHGEIGIAIEAVESDGKTHVAHEQVPYVEAPTRPD
jgi:hypothetical protein